MYLFIYLFNNQNKSTKRNLMKVEEFSSNSLEQTASLINNGRNDKFNVNHFSPIDELNLIIKKQDSEDVKELNIMLVEILGYPSTEYAELHAEAMRLGNYDLEDKKQLKESKLGSAAQEKNLMKEQAKYCNCCGFIKQEDTISLTTGVDDIKNCGTSTSLFFATLKNLIFLLLILSIIYSIFAIITNILASNNNTKSNEYKLDYLTISLSSKMVNDNYDNRRYYFISAWLGVVTLIIWMIIFFVIKQREETEEHQYDKENISCSDYSIVMEQMPLDTTQKTLQDQLNSYYDSLLKFDKIPQKLRKPFKINKINIGKPFYLNEAELKDDDLIEIEKGMQKVREEIISMIKERQQKATFSLYKTERTEKCDKYKELKKKKYQKLKQNEAKIKDAIKKSQNEALTTVFVSFETNINKNLILYLNNIYLLKRIKSLFGETNKFVYQIGDNMFTPKITKAPEPEDIIWQNLGLRDCNSYMRKLFTFTITAILLGGSFGIVYGLTKAQDSAGNDRVLSIIISVVIALVNIIIGQVIQRMTFFQKDYTVTNIQASLAIKIIVAQMINTIFTPVIIAYYIKTSTGFYKVGGLVDNIFMTSISLSIVPPIITMIEPLHYIMALIRCIKRRASSKLYQNQKEHNILHEGIDFQVGFNYISVVNLFMFACFYVSLQPIVSFIAVFGIFLYFWVQKWCLFNRYKRPIPGTDFVNDAIYQIIFLGPLIYSLGSLTWSNLDPSGIPPEALIPNLICVGISSLLIFVPMDVILKQCCRKEQIISMGTYKDDRIFFASEYDRLNPMTSDASILEFKAYIQGRKKDIQNLSEEKRMQIFKKINFNNLKSQMNQNSNMNPNMFAAFLGQGPMNNFGSSVAPPMPFMSLYGGNNYPMPMPQQNNQMMNPNMNNPMNILLGMQPPRPNNYSGPHQGFQQPGFQQPGYQQPGFQQPGYQQNMQRGMNPGMQVGMQPGMYPGMQPGMGNNGINFGNLMPGGMGRQY